MDKIEFFGSVDKNKDGKIGAERPSWAQDSQVNELSEEIDSAERSLARHGLPEDSIPIIRQRLEANKKKLESIVASRPKLTEEQADRVAKEYKKISKEIAESLPTKSEMDSGMANPHEEVKKMTTSYIPVNPEIAEACGVTPREGKINRNEAAKIYQIMGRYLGESSNIELLRKAGRR